jgi:hypothetical protein
LGYPGVYTEGICLIPIGAHGEHYAFIPISLDRRISYNSISLIKWHAQIHPPMKSDKSTNAIPCLYPAWRYLSTVPIPPGCRPHLFTTRAIFPIFSSSTVDHSVLYPELMRRWSPLPLVTIVNLKQPKSIDVCSFATSTERACFTARRLVSPDFVPCLCTGR